MWPGGGETIFCNKFLRTGPSLSYGLDYYVCLKRNSSYSIGHMHSPGEILGNNFPTHSKDCILLLLNSLKQIYVYETEALLRRQPAPCHLWTYFFCDIFWLEQWRYYWFVDIICRDGGILCWCLHVCLPVLQTIAGDLEVDVLGPAPSSILMLRPALSQARVQSGQNPSKDRQHKENCNYKSN